MGLLDQVHELFEVRDLYALFGVPRTASDAEVKKAFYKLALKTHPDRAAADAKELATRRFQLVSKAYETLANRERRAIYDETGEILDDDDQSDDAEHKGPRDGVDWESYWRALFRKIGTEDVEAFAATYRNSSEEAQAVKDAYLEFEGSMEDIINHIMCSNVEDEPRFRVMIDRLIKSKEVPAFAGYVQETDAQRRKRLAKAAKEAKEAEELKRQLGLRHGGNSDDLAMMILDRGKKRFDDVTARLEAKYAAASGAGGSPKGSKSSSASSKAKGKKGQAAANGLTSRRRRAVSDDDEEDLDASEHEEDEGDDDGDDDEDDWEDDDAAAAQEDEDDGTEATGAEHVNKKARTEISKPSSKKKQVIDEPPEHAFQAMEERLQASRAARSPPQGAAAPKSKSRSSK